MQYRSQRRAGYQGGNGRRGYSPLHTEEWDLIKRLGDFPAVTAKAAEMLDPSVMTGYLYDVCKLFSRFYQQCPILACGKQ